MARFHDGRPARSSFALSGLSLIELLAVVAILAVLAGILFPVFGRSVRNGKRGAEIEQLRQIGAAAVLYGDSHGSPPLSVLDFKESSLWESPLWASGADPFRQGFRNELMKAMDKGAGEISKHYSKRIVPFKVSYVGLDDFFSLLPANREAVNGKPNAGWLVSFSEQDVGSLVDATMAPAGAFTRLNFDGSVVHRPSQKSQGQMNLTWLFGDWTDEEKSKEKVSD